MAHLKSGGVFTATSCLFWRNTAPIGGVALTALSAKFSARNSSFVENVAWGDKSAGGDVAFLTSSSTFELHNTTALRGHANVAECAGTGTIYASRLLAVNLTEGLFALGGNCILFLYQTNNDGTEEYGSQLTKRQVFSSGATVNFVQWQQSYPASLIFLYIIPRWVCKI